MRYNRKIIHLVIICSITVLVGAITLQFILNRKGNSDYYSDKLIKQLNLHNQTNVQNIFDFNFDCAYVFKDSYISGDGFAKAYNLDISINQVGNTAQEYIGRVVFVDEFGNFIFEFQYNKNKLIAIKEGMIIYPETKIRKCDSMFDENTCFEFLSSEFY